MLALTFAVAFALGGFIRHSYTLRLDTINGDNDRITEVEDGHTDRLSRVSAAGSLDAFVLEKDPCMVAGQLGYQDMAVKFRLNSTGFMLKDVLDDTFSLDVVYGAGGALDLSEITASNHKNAIVELMVALLERGATADKYPCTFNVLSLGRHLVSHGAITDMQTKVEVQKAYARGARLTAPRVGLPQCTPGSNTTANDEPYEFCTNRCFGMCGVECECIPICGDCKCHAGCEAHDAWCAKEQPCGWETKVHDCTTVFMVLSTGGCDSCRHCQED